MWEDGASLASGLVHPQMFYKYLFVLFICSFIYEPLFGASLPAFFHSSIISSAGPLLGKLSVPETSWLSCTASGLTLQSWIIDLKKGLIFKDHRWPFSFMSCVSRLEGADVMQTDAIGKSNVECGDGLVQGSVYSLF